MPYKVYLELEVSSQRDAHVYATELLDALEEMRYNLTLPAHDNANVWVGEVEVQEKGMDEPENEEYVKDADPRKPLFEDEALEKLVLTLLDRVARRL